MADDANTANRWTNAETQLTCAIVGIVMAAIATHSILSQGSKLASAINMTSASLTRHVDTMKTSIFGKECLTEPPTTVTSVHTATIQVTRTIGPVVATPTVKERFSHPLFDETSLLRILSIVRAASFVLLAISILGLLWFFWSYFELGEELNKLRLAYDELDKKYRKLLRETTYFRHGRSIGEKEAMLTEKLQSLLTSLNAGFSSKTRFEEGNNPENSGPDSTVQYQRLAEIALPGRGTFGDAQPQDVKLCGADTDRGEPSDNVTLPLEDAVEDERAEAGSRRDEDTVPGSPLANARLWRESISSNAADHEGSAMTDAVDPSEDAGSSEMDVTDAAELMAADARPKKSLSALQRQKKKNKARKERLKARKAMEAQHLLEAQ